MKGWKKAIVIGATAFDSEHFKKLPECAKDAKSVSEYLVNPYLYRQYGGFKVRTIIEEKIEFNVLINDILPWMLADDPSGFLFVYSGHGYSFKDKKTRKVYTGLFAGTPWPHEDLYKRFFVPLLETGKPLMRIYDCCYAGTAKVKRDIENNLEIPPIKGITLLDSGQEEATLNEIPDSYDIGRYNNDCIIGACNAKQYAYGAYESKFGIWNSYSTLGHSLFTWLLWSAFHSRTYILQGDLILDDLRFKTKNALMAWLPDKQYKNRYFLIPTPIVIKHKTFPYNFLLPY